MTICYSDQLAIAIEPGSRSIFLRQGKRAIRMLGQGGEKMRRGCKRAIRIPDKALPPPISLTTERRQQHAIGCFNEPGIVRENPAITERAVAHISAIISAGHINIRA